MSSSIFTHAKKVLAEVLDLPASARDARIDELCAGDEALGAEVRSLLKHSDVPDPRVTVQYGARDVLQSILDGDDAAAEIEGVVETGTRLGSYTLGRRLGAGGMGVVFEAHCHETNDTVAVKVLAGLGPASPTLIRRFRHEVDVLRRLDHSGIAALHEAGAVRTAEGLRPFYAMDKADGVPFHHWVRDRQPSVRRIVDVVARVCDAVAHAHALGIVHRDLKPGNILVDDDDRPTVLDFGIARVIDVEAGMTSLHTEAGSLLGTLAYMSPEQASGSVDDVDARSDIYALGAVLYEALAGRLPIAIDGRSVAAAVLEILRRDPPPLREVRDDIDAGLSVVLDTALARERARRYENAATFGDDLRRWLAGRRPLARALTPVQQTVRLAARHKALAGGITIAFVALLVTLLVSIAHRNKAQRASESAQRAADRGRIVAASAALDAGEPLAALESLEAVTEAGRAWEWHHHRQRLEPWSSRFSMEADTVVVGLASDVEEIVSWHVDGRLVRRPFTGQGVLDERFVDIQGEILEAAFTPDVALGVARVARRDDGIDLVAVNLDDGKIVGRIAIPNESDGLGVSASGDAVVWTEGKSTIARWHRPTDEVRRARYGSSHLRPTGLVLGQERLALAAQFGVVTLARLSDLEMHGRNSDLSRLPAFAVSWSPDDERVAIGLQSGSVVLLDGATGEIACELVGHRGHVVFACFMGHAERLATIGIDNTLRIWDIPTRRPTHVYGFGQGRLERLATTLDGKWLLVSHASGEVSVLDVERTPHGELVTRHDSYVYDVDVLADGTIVSAGWDNRLRFTDAHGFAVAHDIALDDKGTLVSAAPSGTTMLARSGPRLVLLESPTAAHPIDIAPTFHRISSVAWFGDCKRALIVGRHTLDGERTPRCAVLDVTSGGIDLHTQSDVTRAALAPDERTVATFGSGEVELWRYPGWQHFATIPLEDTARTLAFSPDGAWLAIATPNDGVVLVDVETRASVYVIAAPASEIWDLVFSPDSTRLALGCHDGVIVLHDVGTWRRVARLRGHTDYVKSIAFNADGTFLVSGSGDGTVRVWHTRPLAERLASTNRR